MRKLVLGTLLLAGLSQALTGCIISSDDDNGGGTGDGILFQPTWVCPDQADTITITATPTAGGASLTPDNFDCAAGTADIFYDPGDYDVEVRPEGGAGEFASVFTGVSGVDGDLVQDSFDFTVDPGDNGFLTLTWTVNGQDAATGCGGAGADGVSVLATLTGPNTATDDKFDCVDGGGVTDPLPIGDYTVDVSALQGETAISDPDPQTTSIDFGDQLQDLGNIDLNIQ